MEVIRPATSPVDIEPAENAKESANSFEVNRYPAFYSEVIKVKGKGKGRALDIAPQVTNLRGAQVHGAHKAASNIPALYLPSCSRYSFTDSERMEG